MSHLLLSLLLLFLALICPASANSLPSTSFIAPACGSALGHLAFAGGYGPSAIVSNLVEIYDVWSGAEFIAAGNITVAGRDLAAASLPDRILFAGGSDFAKASFSASVYMYMPALQTIVLTDSITTGRSRMGGAANDRHAVFAGGCGLTCPSSEVNVYDASGRAMLFGGQQSTARYGLAGAGWGQYIVFAGGQTDESIAVSNVDLFDSGTLTYTEYPGLFLSLPRMHLAGAVAGGYIVFAGGFTAPGSPSTAADIYDMRGVFPIKISPLALTVPRGGLSAAAALNQFIYFGGGLDVNAQPVATVEVFDVQAGTFSNATALRSTTVFPGAAGFNDTVVFSMGASDSTASFPAAPWVSVYYPGGTPSFAVCPPPIPMPGSLCMPSGEWFYFGNASTNTMTLAEDSVVLINGTLTLLPLANVSIFGQPSAAPIIVDSAADIDGVLTLVLNSSPTSNSIPVLVASSVTGNFTDVVVVHSFDTCKSYSGTAQHSPNSISVLLSTSDSACHNGKKLSTAAIIGIAVGGGIVVLAILVVIGLLLYRKYHGHSAMFTYSDRRDIDVWR